MYCNTLKITSHYKDYKGKATQSPPHFLNEMVVLKTELVKATSIDSNKEFREEMLVRSKKELNKKS